MTDRATEIAAEDRATARILLVIAGLATAGLAFAVIGVPILSDGWSHLQNASRSSSVFDAFDPRRVPLRPLQHLQFWCIEHWFEGSAVLGRLLPLAMHAASVVLVWSLARGFSCRAVVAAAATCAYAVWPTVTSYTWIAAIGWPGRQVALLAGLVAFQRFERTRTAGAGLCVIGALLFGLGWHQSAIILPALCWLLVVARDGLRAGLVGLRQPLWWALAAVAVPYVVYVGWFRPERAHGGMPGDAIPASLARAVTCVLPSVGRHAVLDVARGAAVSAAGLVVVIGFGLVWVWAVARGLRSALGRWVVLAGGLELAFLSLSAPYLQRYSYFVAGLSALLLASLADRRGRGALTVVLLVMSAWAVDCIRDAEGMRRCGVILESVAQDVRAARADLGDRRLTLVDLPSELGLDAQFPLLRYGADEFLRRRAGVEDVEFWEVRADRNRVRGYRVHGYQGAHSVTEEDVDRARRDGDRLVLRFDPEAQRLVRWEADR